MTELTVEKLINLLPDAYNPGDEGIPARIQVVAQGEGGGEWVVTLDADDCKVEPGVIENPDLKLSGKSRDIVDIASGKLDAMKAFMLGKVRFSGSMNLAIKISQLFVIPPELREKF